MRKIVWALCLFPTLLQAQRGVDGPRTISASTVVNEYTALTANAAIGATTLTVTNNGLNTNNRFGAGNVLAQGDLIMIYQAQGATMDATPDIFGAFSQPNTVNWGAILNYNNCGNYELAEVVSVSGSTTITIACGLKNAYTATGHAQVIRVPRYTTLTITGTGILTGDAWNGTIGGVVAVEVDGATTINGGGVIHANNIGFRPGLCVGNTTVNGGGYFASNNDIEGAEKGESIAGYTTEYTAVLGRYCMGAPANGGGGGTSSNAGGGGGANGGTGTWNGNGIPDPNPAYATAWAQEVGLIASTSGGGRGGYTHSANNLNAAVDDPGLATWGGDSRRVRGGYGGRPLDYSTGKIFFGGGGGSGEQNNGYGGQGGAGGGIVFIMSYGNVTGNGQITANGQNGANTLTPAPAINSYTGHDGAGGAGGGGAIIVNATGTVSGISITSNGGQGGNNNILHGALHSSQDAYGPGGGGGGGYIAVSNGTPTRTTNGGNNGVTNGSGLSEFPPNGATRGTSGTNNATVEDYSFTLTNDTICSGGTVTLTAVISGVVPGGTTLTWYSQQFGGSAVGTGTSFTTPVLASTTTYWVGFCPGWYRLPVTVVVGSNPTINTAGIVITNETCAGNDGSISGIVVTGTGTLTYTWNGNASANADLSGASAGNYTLVVTDAVGCSASSGPHTIGTGGGPVINTTNMVITQTTCGNNNGSITGITVSGGTGTLTLDWNGNTVGSPDLTNLAPGSYTFTVTDGIGCVSSVGPFTINPSSNPVIDITAMSVTDATCGNNNGSITGIVTTGGSGTYTYTWNGNSNPDEDIFSLTGGTYTLVVTDALGCSDTEGPITVNSFPSPVIDDNNIVITNATCSQSNGSITGIVITGGASPLAYDWNGTTSATQDTTGIAAGSYTFTVTDNNGCSATSGPYTITVTTNPTISAVSTNVTCFGYADGTATASAIGGDGNYSFQWNGGPATSSYTGLGPGNYTVIVTDGNGCQDATLVTVTEPAEIIGTITGNTLLCTGDVTTLTAAGSTQFLWNNAATTAAITVSPADDTTYVVIVSDGTCADTVTANVVVNDLPIAGITGDSILCEGESTSLTATGGGSYLWSTSDTLSTLNLNPGGSMTLTVTVTNNCGTDNASVNIMVNPPPTADAGSDVTINLGSSTTLNGNGGTSYIWSPSTGLSCSNCQNPDAEPTVTTDYIVTVTDANGCSDTDTVKITVEEEFVLFIPDAFSPNNDGKNEILYVRGIGLENFVFRLYDRWGEMVFETTDVNIGWDGIYKGVALNEGVFVYVFEGNFIGMETFEQKGNITLHR